MWCALRNVINWLPSEDATGTGCLTAAGREGPLVNGEHGLCEPGPTLLNLALRAPMISSGPQGCTLHGRQLRCTHKWEPRLVNSLVDALVAELHPGLVG